MLFPRGFKRIFCGHYFSGYEVVTIDSIKNPMQKLHCFFKKIGLG